MNTQNDGQVLAGKERKKKKTPTLLPMASVASPASHEGQCNAVGCQSLVFNWLPCVDHWTVLSWIPEAAIQRYCLAAY